jgi:hypothetical protein
MLFGTEEPFPSTMSLVWVKRVRKLEGILMLEVTMITANVIKGIHDLLGEHGLEQKSDERFSDFVARALNLSARQAEVLLEALGSGATPEEAMMKAEIDPNVVDAGLLARIARTIGMALGEISKRV